MNTETIEWLDWLPAEQRLAYARTKIENELGNDYTTVLTFDGRLGIVKKDEGKN